MGVIPAGSASRAGVEGGDRTVGDGPSLQFHHDALGELGADPVGAPDRRLVLAGHGGGEFGG